MVAAKLGSHLKQIHKILIVVSYSLLGCRIRFIIEKIYFDYLNKNEPNLIINLAAFTKVDQAEIDQEETYAINYMGVVFK